MHPDDRENGAELYAELVRGDRDSYRREALFVTKDGRTVIAHLAAALVRDADGKPAYVIAMAEDVTEQKQLEEQLRQSQKLEAIGRLAGGVAHDFNNMLTAIGGYTAFALEHADDGSPLRSDLDEIRKATDRAALLTRQLLAFSRKQVLKPELLNLNEIVVELETMLRPLIGEDIVLTTRLDPALGPIEADPGQLEQVVMNLVVNARDAMPAGGALSIETANVDVRGRRRRLDRARPLRHADGARHRRGNGRGDAVADLRAVLHDEGVRQGNGARPRHGVRDRQAERRLRRRRERGRRRLGVHDLPAPRRRRAASRSPRSRLCPPRRVPEPVPPDAASKTVLVVEDEDVVRGLVRQVLKGAGFEVLVARDGEEAFALAAKHHVDVLLTDLMMPKLRRPGGRRAAARHTSRPEGRLHVRATPRRGFSRTVACRREPHSSRSRSPSRS